MIIKKILHNRQLIWTLTKRDIISKYKGSFGGMLWSFLIPLLMLAVYTFVFSVIFKAKWNAGSDSKTEFALILFTGLIFFNFFSECINRAPNLITSNINYVKKIVFPIEILPIVSLCSALYQLLISSVVWLLFFLMFFGLPPITIFQVFLLIIPFVFLILGISWFLSAIGVYIRDVSQVVGIFVTIMMFMSPIFYPITIVPEGFRKLMLFNPLTYVVEEARAIMVYGINLNFSMYIIQFLLSIVVAIVGLMFFMKTKKGFADVI